MRRVGMLDAVQATLCHQALVKRELEGVERYPYPPGLNAGAGDGSSLSDQPGCPARAGEAGIVQ